MAIVSTLCRRSKGGPRRRSGAEQLTGRHPTGEPARRIIDRQTVGNIFVRSGVGGQGLASVVGTRGEGRGQPEEVMPVMDIPRYPPPHDWLRLPAIRDTDWVEARFGHS